MARPAVRVLNRGGRPTRGEAERRQEHLIETAGAMFMKFGFDGTSIDAVAEAACMSKRTVYARYRDKNELFSAVLRNLIDRWLIPINQFQLETRELEPMLMEIGRHLLTSALAPQVVSLHRIIVGESERRPEFGLLANAEGRERPYQIRRAMLLTRGTRRRRYPRPLQRWRTVSVHPRHHLFLGRRIPKQPRQRWIVKGHPTTDFAD